MNRIRGYQSWSRLLLTFLSILLGAVIMLSGCITTAPPAPAPTLVAPSPAPAPLPTAPKLLTPHNGATGVELKPRLLWEPVPKAKGYELLVSRNSDFSDIVHSVSLVLTSYQPSLDLTPSTHYYWMIAAKLNAADPNTPVAWSPVWTFTTAQELVSTPEPSVIANTPNGPSTGKINQSMTFSTSATSNVEGSLECRFDWGDGSYSNWAFVASASHSWSKAGTHSVRAQARGHGTTSEWSSSKSVTITSSSSSSTSAFLKAPTEVCPGNEIMVQAKVPRKCKCLLRVQKTPYTNPHTAFFWIKTVDADDDLIAQWNCVMPLVPPGKYELQVAPFSHNNANYFLIGQDLLVGEPDKKQLAEIIPRSPSDPQIMQFYVTPDAPKVRAAVQDILSGEWRWAYSDFEALRQWVWAHVFYRFDSEIYGKDYWQLPVETLELGTGDCEDFAILLCTLLRAYGVSADDVYVAIGCAKDGGGCHGYLLERYYKGTWRVLEPQAELISSLLVFNRDVFTDLMYEERYCFNDQDYFKGAPTLPPGTYEFEVEHSAWPATRGASVEFQRQLGAGEIVAGSVEWLKDDRIIYDWNLNIYDPKGDPLPSWSGTNKAFSFSFISAKAGLYRIEILKRDYMPRCARLTVNPTDWEQR